MFETIAPIVADFAGGLFGSSSAKKAAKQQMEFQERMRATQYQTAVEDLKAAGLNPMLAYTQGGAGNLAGATYETDQFKGMGNSAIAARNKALEAENLKATNEQIKSTTEANKALSIKHTADAQLSNAVALRTKADILRIPEEITRIKGDPRHIFGDFLETLDKLKDSGIQKLKDAGEPFYRNR